VLIQLNQTVQSVHAELYPEDFRRVVDLSSVRTFFTSRLGDPRSVIGIAAAEGVPVGYVWFDVQVRPETASNPPRSRILCAPRLGITGRSTTGNWFSSDALC